ncbi:hypothetical protein HOY80DRAFT_1018115 [Tuber brumale]|nr:hypothetical protein HOY80DRAFT_1018115 [Tuber brumale]
MPPKRRHTKSRNGCMTCRRRRVKCDEIRPICTNCTRRELDCTYTAYCPPGRPGISRDPSSPSSCTLSSCTSSSSCTSTSCTSLSSSSSSLSQVVSSRLRILPLQQSHTPALSKPRRGGGTSSSAPTPLAALTRQLDLILLGTRSGTPSPLARISLSRKDLDNLSLLHHFSIRTYSSLGNEKSTEVFRTEIPRIALRNELTMHALLALTALHMSITLEDPTIVSHYQVVAAGHYDQALRALRTAIRDRPEYGDHILAASTLITFYGFACGMTEGEAGRVPRVIGWIPLFEGVYAIIKEWWPLVIQGDLRLLLERAITQTVEDGDFIALPTSLNALVLEALPASNVACGNGDEEIIDAATAAVYQSALDKLRMVWNTFWTTGYMLSTAWQFFAFVPTEYTYNLQHYKPRALVIFCYFLCMVKKVDGLWWAKGSAQETFVDIERKLDARWGPWLEWPRNNILGDCEVVGSQS